MKLKDALIKEDQISLNRVDMNSFKNNPLAYETINALNREGFKGTYNTNTGEGTIYVGSHRYAFQIAKDKVYLDVGDIYFKKSPDKVIKNLKAFLDYVDEYGGEENRY